MNSIFNPSSIILPSLTFKKASAFLAAIGLGMMSTEVLASERISKGLSMVNTRMLADSSLKGQFVIPTSDKNKFRTENIESIGIIPQGITPNGDGKNDKLVIDGILGLKNKLSIFNRWGNLVFEKENYANDWGGEYLTSDSTSDSKLLPDGIYYYVIDFYGQKENISTYVLINRLAVK
ncbi:gliding motility-associated C-terminal domain-containing protein [Aquirufa nivalisilvae]|jgi:gliding motility-associated-like protein|uniref:gliding motility-associated C-terminal domain-containing protein n=1 Tax=Aquirufa nivalisilvae TaxID=2516557 RepID=UPI0022A93EFB|nr:gliding motility-associated C-terminal domain-containing protein [Aquirufa nivalisilvae]MCZ2479114.1 gliding motility-associated C-terminal domain-containing protein [Aquirufa nivalisilvae]MCZ2483220.1 gliding motility-associated C-terminal domain-containing protein [Aquirufa nivalisilvae]